MAQFIPPPATRPCAAHRLGPTQRGDLAVQVLRGQESVRPAAREHDVRRKFVARQTETARQALDHAFRSPEPDRDEVLFTLPVTKAWLEQAALGLMLLGQSSLRGVGAFFRDLFDDPLAHTTVRNIFRMAVGPARTHNAGIDPNHVRIGARDEIFPGATPIRPTVTC